MPVTLTYPGVYIEEISSGVRTIIGVATSIAAFVGWAPKGPTDEARRVLNWTDYERMFGGLHPQSFLGYAVYHFFINGGQQAYIVRLTAPDAVAATASAGDLQFEATGPGDWANHYEIEITPRSDAGMQDHFRLTVKSVQNGLKTEVESFENLSMQEDDPRFVASVVNASSAVINVEVKGQGAPPQGPASLAGGSDGMILQPDDPAFHTALLGDNATTGVYRLKRVDLFNLLCVPGESDSPTLSKLQKFCRVERAFLIADCAKDATLEALESGPEGLTGDDAINAAFYFPWVEAPDPKLEGRKRAFPPCGFVAGIYARTDVRRGVWKAPAGTEASLTGVMGLKQTLTDDENGILNPKAVNCIRSFPTYGTVLWGARTLQGNDERGSEWKYIPIRRTALYIEETLFRATKWVVFEPNDEPLWAQIRLNVGVFMHDLFLKGAFQGASPKDAYFVKCDKETNPQADIDRGIVNIIVGFAPLKPAEFVIIKLQQIAGELQV